MIPRENGAFPWKIRFKENTLVFAQIDGARSMTRSGRIFIAELYIATSRRPQISSMIKRKVSEENFGGNYLSTVKQKSREILTHDFVK